MPRGPRSASSPTESDECVRATGREPYADEGSQVVDESSGVLRRLPSQCYGLEGVAASENTGSERSCAPAGCLGRS